MSVCVCVHERVHFEACVPLIAVLLSPKLENLGMSLNLKKCAVKSSSSRDEFEISWSTEIPVAPLRPTQATFLSLS